MMMKQVELVRPRVFALRQVPRPKPAPSEALIRVKAVGICGSDIHAYYGEHPFMSCPIVMGHEAAGEIVELGAEAAGLSVGQRVVLRPQQVCGACHMCRHGRYNICRDLKVIGCQSTGASSEYFSADASLFYPLPDALPYDEGTMIEPLAVGIHAVKQARDVRGKNILVIGAGTIGNLLAQSAMAMGAAKVMITDVADQKLRLARQCGIPCPVNVAGQDLGRAMEEAFGPDGADAVYECSANPKALDQILSLARKGIPIVVVGVYSGHAPVNLANLQDREYRLIGSLMYVHEDYVQAIELAGAGKIQLRPLISREFPLEQAQEAYRYIEAQKGLAQKVILTV